MKKKPYVAIAVVALNFLAVYRTGQSEAQEFQWDVCRNAVEIAANSSFEEYFNIGSPELGISSWGIAQRFGSRYVAANEQMLRQLLGRLNPLTRSYVAHMAQSQGRLQLRDLPLAINEDIHRAFRSIPATFNTADCPRNQGYLPERRSSDDANQENISLGWTCHSRRSIRNRDVGLVLPNLARQTSFDPQTGIFMACVRKHDNSVGVVDSGSSTQQVEQDVTFCSEIHLFDDPAHADVDQIAIARINGIKVTIRNNDIGEARSAFANRMILDRCGEQPAPASQPIADAPVRTETPQLVAAPPVVPPQSHPEAGSGASADDVDHSSGGHSDVNSGGNSDQGVSGETSGHAGSHDDPAPRAPETPVAPPVSLVQEPVRPAAPTVAPVAAVNPPNSGALPTVQPQPLAPQPAQGSHTTADDQEATAGDDSQNPTPDETSSTGRGSTGMTRLAHGIVSRIRSVRERNRGTREVQPPRSDAANNNPAPQPNVTAPVAQPIAEASGQTPAQPQPPSQPAQTPSDSEVNAALAELREAQSGVQAAGQQENQENQALSQTTAGFRERDAAALREREEDERREQRRRQEALDAQVAARGPAPDFSSGSAPSTERTITGTPVVTTGPGSGTVAEGGIGPAPISVPSEEQAQDARRAEQLGRVFGSRFRDCVQSAGRENQYIPRSSRSIVRIVTDNAGGIRQVNVVPPPNTRPALSQEAYDAINRCMVNRTPLRTVENPGEVVYELPFTFTRE